MQAHTLTHSHTDLFLEADAEKIFCSKYRNIFEKLNHPYDLCFSVRHHKKNRTEILDRLSKFIIIINQFKDSVKCTDTK